MEVFDKNKVIAEIIEKWAVDEALFDEFKDVLHKYVKNEIMSAELNPYVYCRVKDMISMIKTAVKKKKQYSEINDKLGLRFVTHFKSEIGEIDSFIRNNFMISYFERKADKLKYYELGYVSDHYEATIKTGIPDFDKYEGKFNGLIFEIQVRTICQHAWADVEHALAYKQDVTIDELTKRKIFRLTSLLEICDDEFDSINLELLNRKEFIVFYIIKKLEGKYFKYSKRDYDKELSYENINILKSLFGNDDLIKDELVKIIQFIESNDYKINLIFDERKEVMKYNLFLSQPEIFLIWYFLELKEYDLISLWENNFYMDDLSKIATIWGKPILIKE